jgi:hypothetical protein
MSLSFPTMNSVTPLATVTLAIWAAGVTYRSWRDSREKIRLDLFNRRFDIYLRTLTFYLQLIVWTDAEEQKALTDPFVKASREARFIFPSKSGVYEYLQEFATRAFRITHYNETIKSFPPGAALYDEESNKVRMKLVLQRTEDANWILGSIEKLERLMKPYMSFERL